MKKARLIRNQRFILEQGRFEVIIKAYEVTVSRKFPLGIKQKCVLVDVEQQKPRILLDNHEPYGFHLHTRLPDDPEFRASLDISDYDEAIKIFFNEIRKVVSNES